MIDLHVLNRSILRQPVGTASMPHVAPAMWARDTFTRGVNGFARGAQQFADALFPPQSRRPVGKTLNALFNCGIAHNSVVDLVLHAIFVGACCAVFSAGLGVAFHLEQETVNIISLAMQFAWHVSDPNGLFYNL